MYVVQRDRLQLSHFFLQQSFIILLSLLSPIPCNPYKQEVREDGNTLFYARKMPAATTLSTLFHGTSLPCPVDKAGLCNKHGKLVQPRNCDFPCQSI